MFRSKVKLSRFLVLAIICGIPFTYASNPSKINYSNRVVEEDTETKIEVSRIAVPAKVSYAVSYLESGFYAAQQKEGIIGTSPESPIDAPTDNIFHVELAKPLSGTETIWLTYELMGVNDHSGISKSINDELAIGGYWATASKEWTSQKELVHPDWMKVGDNIIRFSLPKDAKYNYAVRKVGLQIDNSLQTTADTPQIHLNRPVPFDGENLYLKGVITGEGYQSTRIHFGKQEVEVINGAFETIWQLSEDQLADAPLRLKITFPNGDQKEELIPLETPSKFEYRNAFSKEDISIQQVYDPLKVASLHLAGAALVVDTLALHQESKLSITALRSEDLPPLNHGMVNVTAQYEGYRFLPHGTQFEKQVTVQLDFDPAKIPGGFSADDIHTYYFDEGKHTWLQLDRDSVSWEGQAVVSVSTHFTDMINAVIQVPESPETQAYTPTMIKDLKVADPAAAVSLMAPPSANNMGGATTAFPFKIPTGRQGLQPGFALQYNSEGGHSWVGFGWDLSFPAITIETRWGVPRFNEDFETETYLVNGAQLFPTAHRKDLESRDMSGQKQFWPRIEGAFNRIIRYGTTPKDYTWEVTDKNGVRYLYGGKDGVVSEDAVLRNHEGNISHWALLEVRDLNDNFVKYHCVHVKVPGIPGSTLNGDQLYVDRITYTGHGSEEGKYEVRFTRDREQGGSNFQQRLDVDINARLGFKRVTADRLQRIDFLYDNQLVRSYSLKYAQGAFFKTLLGSVSELDAQGNLFTTHSFEYFDDVRTSAGQYEPMSDSVFWTTGLASDLGTEFDKGQGLFSGGASALSGTSSTDFGFGMAITVGANDGNPILKSLGAGGSFSYSESNNQGVVMMLDINGDNLPDEVYVRNNSLKYRPNISSSNSTASSFGPEREVMGLGDTHFREKSRTKSKGVEVHGSYAEIVSAFYGWSKNDSESITSTYFEEVNGDQLIDLVRNGTVYFNHIDENTGDPRFTKASGDTPSIIRGVGAIDPSFGEIDTDVVARNVEENPLHDVVRIWETPRDGLIQIDFPLQLLQDNSALREFYETADGVIASIQLETRELWRDTLDQEEYDPKNHSIQLPDIIRKGQRLFFRLQSRFDGAFDQVIWNPMITYLEENAQRDSIDFNNERVFQFSAKEDFLLSGPISITAPIDGTIEIAGNFSKPITSDSVTLELWKTVPDSDPIEYAHVRSKQFAWDEEVNAPYIFQEQVKSGDEFWFRVTSATNVQWSEVLWEPEVYYIESDDPNFPPERIFNEGTPLINYVPSVDYWVYPDEVRTGSFWTSPLEDTVTMSVSPTILYEFPGLTPTVDDTLDISFSVKRRGEAPLISEIQVYNGEILSIQPNELIVEAVTPEDTLMIEYHTIDRKVPLHLTRLGAAISRTDLGFNIGGLDHASLFLAKSRLLEEEDSYVYDRSTLLFGPMYRGWGQFIYNGNSPRSDELINLSLLKLDDDLAKDPKRNPDNAYSPSESLFVMLLPEGKNKRWVAYDAQAFIKKDTVSSSRMGQDDPKPFSIIKDNTNEPDIVPGIRKRTQSTSTSESKGVSTLVQGLNGTSTEGENQAVADFMDVNGDRYPDVVTTNKIQYTSARGSLETEAQAIDSLQGSQSGTNNSSGASFGGTFILSEPSQGKVWDLKGATFEIGGGRSSAGFNANYGKGNDSSGYSLKDINGDGLPDKIFKGGEVALNLGYSFAKKENWGFEAIQEGLSFSDGGGLGINIGAASIVAGFGLSYSSSSVERSIQDVNGDGLADIVAFGKPIRVRLNTGNGFSIAIPWHGISSIMERSSSSESLNAAFTGCLTLPIPPIKICFNPSANGGLGASREHASIRDIDGDGYPDFLRSNAPDHLVVSTSKIGRTNKLKSIRRPLGSSITMNYERVGNTYPMPNSVWTLSEVEVYDGFDGDGADRMVTTFEYEDGFFDRHEREFYGFGTVKSHQLDTENGNAVYRSIVQAFNNSNYYEKGLLLREALQDGDGNLYTETEYAYQLQDILTGAALPAGFEKDDSGAAFPAMIKQEKRFYEGQASAGKSTTFNYAYDRYGNTTYYLDLGEATAEDDLAATIDYHEVEDKHLVGIPSNITVTGGSAAQIYRKREASIDQSTGNVTQIRQFLEDGTQAIYDLDYDTYGNIDSLTRPSNAQGERLGFKYAYDPSVHIYTVGVSDSYGYSSTATYDLRFGQTLSSTDMNGVQILYELDDLGRIIKITAPYEIANGIDYTIQHEYHPDAAIPWARTQHYDPSHPDNALETVIFIDGLARQLQVKKDASIFVGEGQADEERLIVSGTIRFDAFGRTISTRYPSTESKGNEDSFNTIIDPVSPTETTYDVLDRPISITLPDLAATSYNYTFGPDRNNNSQFLTRVTDPNGIVKDQFADVRGRQVAMKDYLEAGSDHIWTSYAYNAINELIEVKDHEDNKIQSSYDWLGRRTQRIHPDAGTTDYQYDLASNLMAKITENLRQAGNDLAIRYTYELERLQAISYPLYPSNNVFYEYGDPGEDFHRAGRIRTQKDATGEQTFFYGRLGEITKNIRTIKLENEQERSFTTRWTYDTWNRITSMVYPDLEILTYSYNLGGKLQAVKGSKRSYDYSYLTQIGYDKFEQKVFQSHGNGTKSTYDYEEDRRRLSHMLSTTASGRPMMNNSYQYDKVTNITSIKNEAPLPELNQMGGQTEFNFEYDDLYRLVSAQGSWRNKITAQRFGLQMEYNKLHDITGKRQRHQSRRPNRPGWTTSNLTTYDLNYAYDSDQPHAATQVGTESYTYDGNGNMLSRADDVFIGRTRQLIWDEEDRLLALDDDERRHTHTYDADDIRVIKRKDVGQFVYVNGELVSQSENLGDYTVYVGPHLVINAAGYTKHFFIENQRITSKLGAGGPYGLGSNWGDWENWSYWEDWDILANDSDWDKIDNPYSPEDEVVGDDNWGNWGYSRELFEYYFHPDHLGSNTFITDALGEVHQHLEYLPYGEVFVDEHRNIDRTSYLFNGKELDEETGLYYYGARYYEPKLSRWLSVDPMMEETPNWSPYNYGLNNPILYIDPDGQQSEGAKAARGKVVAVFYHGGPFGGGKTTTAGKAGKAGQIFNSTKNFSQASGRQFTGRIVSPGATSGSSVKNGLDFIKEQYEPGDQVIIYGYSYGVDAAVDLTNELGEATNSIPVDLLLTVDGSDGPLQNMSVNTTIPENVENNLNIYQTNHSGASSLSRSLGASSSDSSSGSSSSDSGTLNFPGSHGGPNRAKNSRKTRVTNRNVSAPGTTHGNIQAKQRAAIESKIRQTIKGN